MADNAGEAVIQGMIARKKSGKGKSEYAGKLKDARSERLARTMAFPDGFAEIILNMQLYPKQRDALQALLPYKKPISLMAANGGGKTAIVATAAVLWHLTIFPKGKVNATSASYRQVRDQLYPALLAHRQKFPFLKFSEGEPYIRTPVGGHFRGFKTDDPGMAEGDHDAGEDAPLLYIVDEAKSAPPWLKGVVEARVRPTRLMLLSSPGLAEGWFYESQGVAKDLYHTVNLSAYDCPHFTENEIEKIKLQFAGDPAFIDSVLGVGFIPMTQDAVVDYKALDLCLGSPCSFKDGTRHAFCDFAWSNDGDENVMAVRTGNRVTIESTFHADSLHKICDTFVAEFVRLGLESGQISGDEGGGGKLVMDELEHRGWVLNRVNNGQPATDSTHYQNTAAEMWYEGSKQITNRTIILPDDPVLRGQLLSRRRGRSISGKLSVESKKDMRARGVNSPDRADAVLGAMMPSFGYGDSPLEWASPMGIGKYQSLNG